MNRPRLEDFRYPKRVDTHGAAWSTIAGWQRSRLVTIKPESRTQATVELTAEGLRVANEQRRVG